VAGDCHRTSSAPRNDIVIGLNLGRTKDTPLEAEHYITDRQFIFMAIS
jgi:hypothetical protein